MNQASQFLDVPKLDINFSIKQKVPEGDSINMQVVSFLSRDIYTDIDYFIKHKILPDYNSIRSIGVMAKKEEKWMQEEYDKSGKGEHYWKNYMDVTDFFRRLASKKVSDVQKKLDEDLEDILYCVLATRYVIRNIPFLITRYTQRVNKEELNKLSSINEMLYHEFLLRYRKVSNSKFDITTYDSLFDRIRKMSKIEFTKLIRE